MKSLKFTQKEWDSIKEGAKNIKIDPSLNKYSDSEFAKEKTMRANEMIAKYGTPKIEGK